jgi:hypothetical protein
MGQQENTSFLIRPQDKGKSFDPQATAGSTGGMRAMQESHPGRKLVGAIAGKRKPIGQEVEAGRELGRES